MGLHLITAIFWVLLSQHVLKTQQRIKLYVLVHFHAVMGGVWERDYAQLTHFLSFANIFLLGMLLLRKNVSKVWVGGGGGGGGGERQQVGLLLIIKVCRICSSTLHLPYINRELPPPPPRGKCIPNPLLCCGSRVNVSTVT